MSQRVEIDEIQLISHSVRFIAREMNKLRIRLPIQFERHHSSTHFWSISGLFSPFGIFSLLAWSLMGSVTVLKLDIMVHIMDKDFTNSGTNPCPLVWARSFVTARFKLSGDMSECQDSSVRMRIGLVQKSFQTLLYVETQSLHSILFQSFKVKGSKIFPRC